NQRVMDEVSHIKQVMAQLKNSGIKKRNLDLMYGLPNQTLSMCKATVELIEKLMPEQVTLYETRYNMNSLAGNNITRTSLFEQYEYLYDRLVSLGYSSVFGRNTFTLCNDDGVSSYLRYRMYHGMPYKGFGISAQSMSEKGVSYNILKNTEEKIIPDYDAITEEDIYVLPPEEIIAKYACISLYSGSVSLDFIDRMADSEALRRKYSQIYDFLVSGEYATIDNNICILTKKGFLHYGAVAALFWSESHQNEYWKLS
ncbi:MAG: hypothetical protein ACI4Q4_04925, partial [Oscillospiraceae bacterium]